jgi:hypothetical protein
MAKKSLQLGRAAPWPKTPEQAQIDGVPNPQAGTDYLVRFAAPEFTSICPVTGQPDFAHLVIDYVPGKWLLESKSCSGRPANCRKGYGCRSRAWRPIADAANPVSRTRCGILHAAPQSRDHTECQRFVTAPALQRTASQVPRAALRPGNAKF